MPNQRDEVNRSNTSKTNVNNQKAQNAKSKQTARPWPFQLIIIIIIIIIIIPGVSFPVFTTYQHYRRHLIT